MNRTLSAAIAIASVVLMSTPSYAQVSLSGKYSGTVGTTGATLVVDSIEGDLVKVTVVQSYGNRQAFCRGPHPMEGKLEGNTLNLAFTANAEKAKDCGFQLNLTINGNSITGTDNLGQKVDISK